MDVGERTVDEVLMVIEEKIIKVENSIVAVEDEIKKVEQCLVSCKWLPNIKKCMKYRYMRHTSCEKVYGGIPTVKK